MLPKTLSALLVLAIVHQATSCDCGCNNQESEPAQDLDFLDTLPSFIATDPEPQAPAASQPWYAPQPPPCGFSQPAPPPPAVAPPKCLLPRPLALPAPPRYTLPQPPPPPPCPCAAPALPPATPCYIQAQPLPVPYQPPSPPPPAPLQWLPCRRCPPAVPTLPKPVPCPVVAKAPTCSCAKCAALAQKAKPLPNPLVALKQKLAAFIKAQQQAAVQQQSLPCGCGSPPPCGCYQQVLA